MSNSQERLLLTEPTQPAPQYSATYQGKGKVKEKRGSCDDSAENEQNEQNEQALEMDRGVTLSWKHINVTATTTSRSGGALSFLNTQSDTVTRTILRDVSGIAKAGSFIVIMGASGTGKTTLLNCLTRRSLSGLKVTGDVLVNGKALGDDINRISGYIQQDDLFVGSMTVREHLWFHAVLRMGAEMTDSKRNARIEEVMQEVGIKKCEDTMIGEPGMVKALSGGEKKRLAFASELLTRPSLMFCDEPTSGLDSFMAQTVVQSLKVLADRGRTILCTIHQPSSDVFAMFDQLLVMAEGRVAFLGPTTELTNFLASLGYSCPVSYNPADFVIQTLAVIPGRERDCKQAIQRVSDSFEDSNYALSILQQVEEQQISGNDDFVADMDKISREKSGFFQDLMKNDSTTSTHRCSWWIQFQMCLWRASLDVARKKEVLPARLVAVMLAGIFIGALYWQQPLTNIGVSNLNAAMFLLILNVPFTLSMPVAASLCKEYPLLRRENQDRLYSVSAYYISKILIDIAMATLTCLIYEGIAYWMIGFFPEATAFAIALVASVMMGQMGVAYAHLSSSVFSSAQVSLVLLPAILGSTLIFTGFLVKDDSINWLFKPIAWISAFRYTYQALLINQWRDVAYIECDLPNQSEILNSSVTVRSAKADSSNWCYPNGMAVIYSYEYEPDDLPHCFMILLGLLLGTEIVSYFVLRFKMRR